MDALQPLARKVTGLDNTEWIRYVHFLLEYCCRVPADLFSSWLTLLQ